MTIFIFIIFTSILNVFAFSFEKEMFLHLERDLRLFVYNFFFFNNCYMHIETLYL